MDPIRDLILPGGGLVPAETLQGFMWAGETAGLAWYSRLPELLGRVARKWSITFDSRLPRLSMNLVVFGESAVAGPVVLKTSPPHPEVTAEITTVLKMQGRGYPDLIDHSIADGWSLQQRVLPGTTLQAMWDAGGIDDVAATDVFADMMVRERITVGEETTLIEMDYWLRDLLRYAESRADANSPIPAEAVNLAVKLAKEFLANPRERALLHGDLQHSNILRSDELGWAVIDPKGVVGDRAFEIGAWLYNPIGVDTHPDLRAMTDRRLTQLSARLGIERLHLWKWGLVACVLSDCWTLLDNPDEPTPHALPSTRSLMALPEWELVGQAS